ncbi:WhiB family transcriptional regulator [Streptomyces sp. TX20-6-3]|uniref:WhiB family transcriptional regulator n=1 Tax=Streptomyces sp. TX20-6-3 TaxID=3028705 RepID=UPI0034DDF2AE
MREAVNSPYCEKHEEETPWRRRAACASRDIDPEIFFSPERGRPSQHWSEEAVAICGSCPVQSQCLETALKGREKSGIWGGLTPAARRKRAREQNASATAAS